jgi:hypothetical protein
MGLGFKIQYTTRHSMILRSVTLSVPWIEQPKPKERGKMNALS